MKKLGCAVISCMTMIESMEVTRSVGTMRATIVPRFVVVVVRVTVAVVEVES